MSLVTNYQSFEIELCQIENAQASGTLRRPGRLYVASRILWNLKNHGLSTKIPGCADAVLDLQSGESVQVKSLAEILTTLDAKSSPRK
jgi:hypothetical protein